MSDQKTHVVKLTRVWGTTVLFIGTKDAAQDEARRLNTEYQTDEYVVDIWRTTL